MTLNNFDLILPSALISNSPSNYILMILFWIVDILSLLSLFQSLRFDQKKSGNIYRSILLFSSVLMMFFLGLFSLIKSGRNINFVGFFFIVYLQSFLQFVM
ncbi:hypothetical protein M0811_14727 [Anaeramoeba ignava]|uniref:Uncharacterized protein n=1 Tax=Anaeramoeba ignava TaxID=1746090 RepID=A0A9Q0LU64_ANAIG|nr:hypothetical protein M0811_14727 [Anaeramoeba ignava]